MIGGRFGRRRRTEEGRGTPIDASWLERAASVLATGAVQRLDLPEVPPSFALLGMTGGDGGRRTLLAVSARSGGDALLAALAVELRPEAAGADLVAAAPRFDAASRRRLGALRGPVRTLELGGGDAVLPELPTPIVPEECLAAPLTSPAESPCTASQMDRCFISRSCFRAPSGEYPRSPNRSANPIANCASGPDTDTLDRRVITRPLTRQW